MSDMKAGVSGPEVERWQAFLRGQNFEDVVVNGSFDEATATATKEFQESMGISPDGTVGPRTLQEAFTLGYDPGDGSNWPAPPDFGPLTTNEQRQGVFGPIEFEPAPTKGNPEGIRITNDWESANIGMVTIPQLVGVAGAPGDGAIQFHVKAHAQLVAMFAEWEAAGLKHLILSWEGTYVPRFVRGSRELLSNHTFGTAFDINAKWNGLGVRPALKGETGSVRELVEIAHKHGFYWGGHFSRPDGMHFEVARIQS
jgi:hypothetical protein